MLSEFDKDVLAAGIRELHLPLDTNESLSDTKALGYLWETGENCFRIVNSPKPLDKYTRRSMLSQLSKSFEPLRIFSPFFVKARLILQKLAIDKRDWDDEVPDSVVKEWKMWFKVLDSMLDISLARHYFAVSIPVSPKDNVIYQLHDFPDVSNSAYDSVVYLRRILNEVAMTTTVLGRSKVVLRN